MPRYRWVFLVAVFCCPSCSSAPDGSGAAADIDGDRIAAHTEFLASDELQGRGPGTEGETLATEYIAEQFALAGADPAGDDGYFQQVRWSQAVDATLARSQKTRRNRLR